MEEIARITTENELNGGIVESMTSSSNLDSHIGAKTFIITKIIVNKPRNRPKRSTLGIRSSGSKAFGIPSLSISSSRSLSNPSLSMSVSRLSLIHI